MSDDEMSKELGEVLKPYLDGYFQQIEKEFAEPAESIPENSNSSSVMEKSKMSEVNRFTQLFFEFTNIARQVYLITLSVTDKEAYEIKLSQIIEHFNNDQVLSLPIRNNRIKEIFDTGNNIINDADNCLKIISVFEAQSIDLRKSTLELLEHYVKQSLSVFGSDFKYESNLSVRHTYLPVSITCIVKFRPRTIDDINELSLESIDAFKSLKKQSMKIHLVVIVVTDKAPEEFQKLKFKFQNLIYEKAHEYEPFISLIFIYSSKMKDLKEELISCTSNTLGLAVNFDYEDSPLNHFWKLNGNYAGRDITSFFSSLPDNYFHKSLRFKIPANSPNLFLEYRLRSPETENYRLLIIYVIPFPTFSCHVDLNVVGKSEKYHFEVTEGMALPQRTPMSKNNEYIIYIEKILIGTWTSYTLDVQELFDLSYGKEGLQLQSIAGIRFGGEGKIGRINLL